jgi:hypothetical protein
MMDQQFVYVWWQKKRYCSDMPNVVSAIDGTSHEIQIPSNEPQQKTSPFDINSVVFHFDDFNYGRRSQSYFF